MRITEALLTIVGIQCYEGRFPFSAGRQLIGMKEPENKFDRNAIKILDMGNTTVGYIANKPNTVLPGAITANEVYNHLGDFCVVQVVRSTERNVTCKVLDPDFKKVKLIEAFTKDRYAADYPFTDIYPPKCEYPFDYCEFPFEYALVDIDLTDDTIPDEWRKYLLCLDTGISNEQFDEIDRILDERDMYFVDIFDLLSAKRKKDKAGIESAILDNADVWWEDDYETTNADELSEVAEKISMVLNESKITEGEV